MASSIRRVSLPWLVAVIAMALFIWGNSLVPGEGSSSLSLEVLRMVHEGLAALGLPYEWVTHFLIRKTAHFSEYAVLGILVTHALDPDAHRRPLALFATALVLVAVPSIDETIQLFIDGRSGQVTDVMIDCCGAAFGVALRYLCAWLLRRRRGNAGE